jgi:hypothetical protein
MPASFFNRRKILKSTNTLDLVPVKLVSHETIDNEKIKLLIPRFSQKWLQLLFTGKKKSKEFRISLDETGSMVWLCIDGETSVGAIANQIKQNLLIHNISDHNIDERISIFISRLYQEEYITFKQLL